MTPPPTAPTRKATPEVRRAQRWNIVWVVPIIAMLLGAWLLYRNFVTQGPVANIRFETAEEIYAQKTEVRCRSVKVGIVKEVKLANNLNSVIVQVELNSGLEDLLRQDSRFWVVKPRLSAAEISGLGTLIQGAYIELDPGAPGSPPSSDFQGLEKPPATNSSVPGLRIALTATEAGMLNIGSPIYYRGFEVGRIEGRQLADDGTCVTYNAFIREDYRQLVTKNTRFWNTSGIEINASTQGVAVSTPSLEAMISGGVSFGLTAGTPPGPPVADGIVFSLYTNQEAASHSAFKPTLEFLLLFDQSVRGLNTNSSVEFRGIPIGRISQISFDLVDSPDNASIPVLIEIDPSRVRSSTAPDITQDDSAFFEKQIAKGLRAGLKTTSLLTSAVHIDLDYYPDAAPAALGKIGDHTTFPTIATGFTHIEAQLSALINKLDALPVEEAINAITDTAKNGKEMVATLNTLLNDPALKELPAEIKTSLTKAKTAISSIGPDGHIQGDILNTLDEMRAAIRSIKAVADMIEQKPNALIFGRSKDDDDDDDSQESESRTRPHIRPHRR